MVDNVFKSGADQSDDLANARRQFIEFYHIPSGASVTFKAFLTQFSDQYESEWNDEPAFGRMDPISTFKGTRRNISLGWDVVAGGIEEAQENLERCSLLVSMLYPSYEKVDGGATAISTSPLFRLKFMNLIQNSANGGNANTAEEAGLLGKVGGFTYEPKLDSGFFDPLESALGETIKGTNGERDQEVRFKIKKNHLYPQEIQLSCVFTVIHEHKLGWLKEDGVQNKDFELFPYSTKKNIKYRTNEKNNSPGTTNEDNVSNKQTNTILGKVNK